MRSLSILFAFFCTSCQGTSALEKSFLPVAECPAVLDSTSPGVQGLWEACQKTFELNKGRLSRIDMTTEGFTPGTIRYWFSSGEVDSLRSIAASGASDGKPESPVYRGKQANPVIELYRSLSGGMCQDNATPQVQAACSRLIEAHFDPATGLPRRVRVRIEAPPGVDFDANTGWVLDSALWKPDN